MTYTRSYQQPRRRHDAARWTYTEVDAAGSAVRHIEMRADNGTFLAATARAEVSAARDSGGDDAAADYEARYGVLPEQAGAPLTEMTAGDFAELWRLARCRLDGDAQVQIHEVRPRTPEGLPLVVRCVGGLVRVGSRFDRVRETGEQAHLTVTRIVRYDRDAALLEPSHTAILILSGPAGTAVRAGHHLDGQTA